MRFEGANLISKVFLFYCRKIGQHPAKLRIINHVHRLLQDQIKVKGINDTVLNLVPKDYISGQIIFNQAYEPLSLNLALEILKNSAGAFVDVGANIGLYTSTVLGSFNNKRIVSIEPERYNFMMLNKNIANNKLNGSNVSALNIAVGSMTQLIQLERPVDSNNGTFRVIVGQESGNAEADHLPLLTLETVFKSLNIAKISLMKIDVEGFEMEVFKGMDWNATYKPDNIIMEYSDYVSRTGSTAQDMMLFLTSKGYKPYSVDRVPYSAPDKLPEDNLLFTLL